MKKIRILALLVMICLLVSPAGALAALRAGDVYSEPMSGAQITLPQGFREYNVQSDNMESYYSMSPEDGSVYLIAFGCTDLYGKMEADGKASFSRSLIGNDLLDVDSVADLLDAQPYEVELVHYNNYDFYVADTTFVDDDGDEGISIYGVCYHNGYMYLVRYMGYDRKHVDDLDYVLNSFRP